MLTLPRRIESLWEENSEAPSADNLQLMIKAGRAAQAEGDYALAIAQFETTITNFPDSDEVIEPYFTALREISISQFLIEQFFGDIGWSIKKYRGTDHILPNLSRSEVLHRLDKIAKAVPKSSSLASWIAIVSKTDTFAQIGFIEAKAFLSSSDISSPESPLEFLEGLNALKNGNDELAVSLLSSVVKSNPHLGQGYLLLASALYRQGKGHAALDYINLALLYPSDTWFDFRGNPEEVIHLGKFDEFRIIFFKSEIMAFPENGKYFISLMNGHNEVYEHALSPNFRKNLLEFLPNVMVTFIRKCVYSSPIRHLVAKPAPVSQFLHGKNIADILSIIRTKKEKPAIS